MFIFAISWTAVGRLLPFRKRISWLSFSTPAARWSLTLRRWDFDVTTLDRSDPAALRESCLFALVRGSRFKLEKFQEKRFGILKMTLCVVSFFFLNFYALHGSCLSKVHYKFNSEQSWFYYQKMFFVEDARCETFWYCFIILYCIMLLWTLIVCFDDQIVEI